MEYQESLWVRFI